MDNLKYYNDSLAYDFDLFMPKEKKNTDNVIKMPSSAVKTKQRRNAAKKAVSVGVTSVLLCAFFLAALCGNIFLRLRINEVDSQINDINAEITELEAELTTLDVEFEKIISYTNLEAAATELGMKKMDKDQVVYIQVNNKNTAITADGDKVVSDE